MSTRTLWGFLTSPLLASVRPRRRRQVGYALLHDADNSPLFAKPKKPSPLGILLYISLLTELLAVPLCLFFHAFSSLFFYLSLILFALPSAFFWLAPSPRARKIFAAAYSLFFLLTLFQIRHALNPSTFSRQTTLSGVRDRRVFIASNLHNNEEVLPYYSTALQQLVERLGKDNVFVSIYESHSRDNTKPMLAELDHKLQQQRVPHRILMDDKSAKVGKGDHRNGRIDFLSRVRNVAMEPLQDLQHQGRNFTHVLWINDVYFNPDAILELLDTDAGRFDQACALDLNGNGFYDVWVTRDTQGRTGKRAWPYFVGEEQISGLLTQRPFLVNACWNGATAFDAKWFLDPPATSPHLVRDGSPQEDIVANQTALPASRSSTAAAALLADINPDTAEPPPSIPLRFRTSPRCFSSECQLTSFDIHRAVAPLRPRIWINPRVTVAYEMRTYFQHVFLEQWWLVAPWRVLWRDGGGMLLSPLYKTWPNLCGPWQDGWAAPDAPLAPTSFALPQGTSQLQLSLEQASA